MKKEEIAVRIDTAEQAKRAYQILTDAKEEMYSGTREGLKNGHLDYSHVHFADGGEDFWTRRDNTGGKQLITLDELEELLGVKENVNSTVREFKVGDMIELVSCPYLGGSGEKDFEGTNIAYTSRMRGNGVVAEFTSKVISVGEDYVLVEDETEETWSLPFSAIRHVTEPKQAEAPTTLSISRANLKRVYDIVCTGWKATITETIARHNQFEDNIVFDLAVVKKGYHQSNEAQFNLLKEVFPLPTVKKTIEITGFVNVDSAGKFGTVYSTAEGATICTVGGHAYKGIAVEIKGSYTTETEYDYSEFGGKIGELPF